MAGTPTLLPESGLGNTLRRDAWWMELIPVIVLLGGFGLYATLRAFENAYFYEWGPYLSPFYSPLIDPQHHWWPLSPALLILVGPLGFRATCYYYRKAYYRAFFLDPPACAVGEAGKPQLQRRNHVSVHSAKPSSLFPVSGDSVFWCSSGMTRTWRFFFDRHSFGIGVGSLVLLLNVTLLSLYTLLLPLAATPRRRQARLFFLRVVRTSRDTRPGAGLVFLNERHMLFAWMSLISVGLADFYIRLVASGAIRDLRIL